MTKQCGTCKWWKEKLNAKGCGNCLAPLPKSIVDDDKFVMYECEGQDCPVYEERKEND